MNASTNSAISERDDVLLTLEALRLQYGENAERLSDANEASTRLLLIDKILESLQWSKDQFNPEHAVGHQSYIDYLLTTDRVPRLIVEAKRVSQTFGTPNRKSIKTEYSLKYLKSAFGQPFMEVLSQAERYALERQVPYALLTNGGEWILLQLTLAPGFAEISDMRGLYFGNAFSDNFNLELFWEILYRPHVEEGSLESYFAQLNSKEADYSRTPQAQLGSLQWPVPQQNTYVQEFYQLFFDEIIDPGRRNMLEKCFVTNSRLDRYQGELQRTLRDTAPSFVENAIEVSPEDRKEIIRPRSGDQKGRVVLVAGSVGCGKTTLVHKVLVESRQGNQLIALVIDLIDEVTIDSTDLPKQLWK